MRNRLLLYLTLYSQTMLFAWDISIAYHVLLSFITAITLAYPSSHSYCSNIVTGLLAFIVHHGTGYL